MNVAFGEPDENIFHLVNRRYPIQYNLVSNTESPHRSEIRAKLVESLVTALKALLSEGAEERAAIKYAFQDAPKAALRLAIQKPPWWEYTLVELLLRYELSPVLVDIERLKTGTAFQKSKNLDIQAYFTWTQEMCKDLERMAQALERTINEKFAEAIGAPGEPGDALLIKEVVDDLISFAWALVNWEKEHQSVIQPQVFDRLHALQAGWSFGLFDGIQRIQKELSRLQERIIKKEYGIEAINLNLELPASVSEWHAELRRLDASGEVVF